MANVAWGKRILAIAVACCACAAIAIPAYGFYYVHSDEGEATDSQGAYEVTIVLDETAQGGGVRSELVFVPVGGTVADALNEDVYSSNSQNGLEAIHDYSVSSLSEYLADKSYTCEVYSVEDQEPGTDTTAEGTPETGEDVVLERYDHVVITVA